MEKDQQIVPARPTELAPVASGQYPVMVGTHLGEEASHLWDYIRILSKHRWFILSTLFVVFCTVTIASFKMRPIYEAVGRIEIDKESSNILSFKDLFQMDPGWDWENYLQTQIKILQSDTLAFQVIQGAKLDRNPEFAGAEGEEQKAEASGLTVHTLTGMSDLKMQHRLLKNFQKALDVRLVPRSWLVEISFQSRDPKLAADVVNFMIKLYIENSFRTRYESATQASDWLASQLVSFKSKVEKSEEELVRYQRENEILNLDDKQNITTQTLADLNRQLTEAQAERIRKESYATLIHSGSLEAIPAVNEDRLIQDLREKYAELDKQYSEAKSLYGPEYPKVQRLQSQMQDSKTLMDREVSVIAQRLERDYEAAMKRERLLAGALEKQKREANEINQKSIQYHILKREVDTNKQLYEGLLQRLKEAGVSAGLKSSNIRMVDPARVPIRPAKPRILLNIALSLLAGSFLGVALAFLREYLDNTVKTPDEIEQVALVPALGMVPALSSIDGKRRTRRLLGGGKKTEVPDTIPRVAPELICQTDPRSAVSETYRALRTAILLSASGRPPQIILVTSSLPREGKTTTSMNMAITFAQRGEKTLIIDADLRKPRVHHLLRLSSQHGLSTYLAGGSTFDQIVCQKTPIPNLAAICCGPKPPNPSELLSSDLMKQLLERASREFPRIVIDTAPVLALADATILSVMADGVIVVSAGGVTTRGALRRCRQTLQAVGARFLGVVMNNVDLQSPDYYYYYRSYGYGYRYGYGSWYYYGGYSSYGDGESSAE